MIESDIEVEATYGGILLGTLKKETRAYSGLDPARGQSWSTLSSWTEPTESPVEMLKEGIAKAKRLLGRRENVDAVVMTQSVYSDLKSYVDARMPFGNGELDRFHGIPIYVYATVEEASAAYRQMRLEGKNVLFVEASANAP